jgi:MoaA/NifB/PqqE/SkfB family radical SAM enzyme
MPYHCEKAGRHLHLWRNGEVYLCCPGWVTHPIGNILHDRLASLWNGAAARTILDGIWQGDFRSCLGCPHIRPPGGPVSWRNAPEIPPRSPRISLLMAGYDFQCNLACPSCRTERVVQSEDEEAMIERIGRRLVESGDLESVNVLGLSGGGDPFASPHCRSLIASIPWKELPLLRMSLHTNGLLLDDRHWQDLLGEARGRVIEIQISIDAATEETYRENRGGDWGKLHESLHFASSLRASGFIDSLWLNFVVQANNWREMPAFAGMAKAYGADHVDFGALGQWGTYADEDYRRRAVHLADHPEHAEYLEIRKLARGILAG